MKESSKSIRKKSIHKTHPLKQRLSEANKRFSDMEKEIKENPQK